jgi:hypothetical protein
MVNSGFELYLTDFLNAGFAGKDDSLSTSRGVTGCPERDAHARAGCNHKEKWAMPTSVIKFLQKLHQLDGRDRPGCR